jgi:hypothetical protein
MFWWREILSALNALILPTVANSTNNNVSLVAEEQVRSKILELQVILASSMGSNLTGKRWPELLVIIDGQLSQRERLCSENLALRLEVCSKLEELAGCLVQGFSSVIDRYYPEVEDIWRATLDRIETRCDCLRAFWGCAGETEILNLAERPSPITLAAVKTAARKSTTEWDIEEMDWHQRIFAAARIKYHRQSIMAMSPTRGESRIQKLLGCVRGNHNRFGTLASAHSGYLHNEHSLAFLREAEPAIETHQGVPSLIAYVAGDQSFRMLSDRFCECTTLLCQKAYVDALRIIGGEQVTALFCDLLSSRVMQPVVAQHLIDMASIAVPIVDGWWTQSYDPNQPLSIPIPSELRNTMKRTAQTVRNACKTLRSDGRMLSELANKLETAAAQYLSGPSL